MKYIKNFKESLTDLYKELKEIKISLLDSMDPPMIDVFEELDDYLLEFVEKYGKLTTKHGSTRNIIDFDEINLSVDVGDEYQNYDIAHERNYVYRNGKSVDVSRSEKIKYENLSFYGGPIDRKFYDLYKMKNGKLDLFYGFLIGFDSSYKIGSALNSSEEGYREWSDMNIKEMSDEIKKYIGQALKRLSYTYNVDIVQLQIFDPSKKDKHWVKEKTNDLSKINYPRVYIGITVKNK